MTTFSGPRAYIIGAGVIGLHAALILDAKNYDVTIYEAGGDPRFNGQRWEWADPEFDNVDSNYDVNALRIKGVGGTTLHWGGTIPRLLPHQHAGWLDSHWYEVAETYLGRYEHGPGWFEAHYLVPALAGLNWHYSPWVNTTDPAKCQAYSICSPYCPAGVRYSPLALMPLIKQAGIEIVKNAPVLDIKKFADACDLLIVCAGTIESTRLALIAGIPTTQAMAHGVVMTTGELKVKTGNYRIGYPGIKCDQFEDFDIFVDPTWGPTPVDFARSGIPLSRWGVDCTLSSHTAWAENNIKVALSDTIDGFGVPIPRVSGVPALKTKEVMGACSDAHHRLLDDLGGRDIKTRMGVAIDHIAGTIPTPQQGNILFLGNSVLPTIGKANPTLTALAYALQILDDL